MKWLLGETPSVEEILALDCEEAAEGAEPTGEANSEWQQAHATMDMVKEAFRTLAFSFDELDFHDLKSPPGYECKYQVVPEESVIIHWVAPLSTNFRKQCIVFPRRGI